MYCQTERNAGKNERLLKMTTSDNDAWLSEEEKKQKQMTLVSAAEDSFLKGRFHQTMFAKQKFACAQFC